MRVSVIIPCYNSLEYLPQTLRSVYDQDLSAGAISDFEVVLVDDGGSDDLAAWLEEEQYPQRGIRRVRLIRQDNAGVSAARNFGVRQSSGNLIAFCDSDDLWTPRTASLLAERFIDSPDIGLAYGWYDIIDAHGNPTGRVERSAIEGEAWDRFVLQNPVSASGVMVSRRALAEVGGFAENRDRFPIDVEDWDLWIRVAASFSVAVVPQVLARHRRHDSNSSTDIESLELAYQHLMRGVFADVGPHRQKLRPMAEARYKMILAWQSLNDRRDPALAERYMNSALGDLPQIRRSIEYWRLRASIGVLRSLGDRGYRVVRSANNARRKLTNHPS